MVVLGSGTMTVRQLLALQRDSIVCLTQSAGEDLGLFVNGVLIARGEVAIIDTTTAIRLTELTPAQPALVRA
jgi:flagellar motor switch protein FliN/FliY